LPANDWVAILLPQQPRGLPYLLKRESHSKTVTMLLAVTAGSCSATRTKAQVWSYIAVPLRCGGV